MARTLLNISVVFCMCISHTVWGFSSVSLPTFQVPSFNTDSSPSAPESTASSDDSVDFTSQQAGTLGDVQLPGFLEKINDTQVVENLTTAEADMAQLKSQNYAMVSQDAPSEAEVASLTNTVQGYLSEMTTLEEGINDFEKSIQEFETSRTNQVDTTGSSSSGSTGLGENDLSVLSSLETSLDALSAQIATMETTKQNIFERLDGLSSTMASIPEPQLTENDVQEIHNRLEHLEVQLTSQKETFESVVDQFQNQCSKVDQHSHMFPSNRKGGTGGTEEETTLPMLLASQSSVKGTNGASNAVDKKTWVWESYGSCAVTELGNYEYAWWMIELSEMSRVTEVEITTMSESTVNLSPLRITGYQGMDNSGQLTAESVCLDLVDNNIWPGSTVKRRCDQPIMAKFIKLTRTQSNTYLALCEFKATGYTNYSPYSGMDITQSSTDSVSAQASRSSDGLTSTCSMTSRDPIDSSPWWQIDMKEERTLEAIVLTNRGDEYYKYFSGLRVLVYSSLPSACGETQPVMCASYDQTVSMDEDVTIQCVQPIKGRVIRVFRDNVPDQALSICEVELKLLD